MNWTTDKILALLARSFSALTTKPFFGSCWIICTFGLSTTLSFASDQGGEPLLFVHHRILAKVKEKPISTYDVMRKMDVAFYRDYPEYFAIQEARYEYYRQNWESFFRDLITKELILADAKEHHVSISNGDTRQEMEVLFGPDLVGNLDQIGMSYDEAFQMVQGDLILQKMMSGRVHSKALQQVTPSKIREAYDLLLQDPSLYRPTTWRYRVLTMHGSSLKRNETLGQEAFSLLSAGNPIERVSAMLQEMQIIREGEDISLSEVLEGNEAKLAPLYKKTLSELQAGQYSSPIPFSNRLKKTVRIFFLEEVKLGSFPSFQEMEASIRQKLLDEAIDRETKLYVENLQVRYRVKDADIKQALPEGFAPFTLLHSE